MIKVTPIEGKGRGVLAMYTIQRGTIIEVAPVKPFDCSQDLPTELVDLPVEWNDKEDCIVMGASQFVNHSDDPNCVLKRNHDDMTVSLVAMRDIRKGEELTYKYRKVWFDCHSRTES